MESPVVVDKPPGYHKEDRGFPFDEEEGSGAWSDLAARHPDIAARLRQHPATWARKRRPSSQDNDEFGESFSNFDRFPFDDIPQEFREHFPSHWNRRFAPREEPQPQTSQSPPQQTAATQTEPPPAPETKTSLPQYGLRNTVDLGQKSAADPSLVDADDRNQRSMSAPPESRTANNTHTPKMSGQNHQEQPHPEHPAKVYNIPIMVEGRDQPVINKINENVDRASNFGDSKPAYKPQQPPLDSSYFTEEGPTAFQAPRNFARSFGTPMGKNFQPFTEQKMYPQSAANFAKGPSPQRSQSPKPQQEFTKVPVYHETSAKPQPQVHRPQQKPQPQPQPQQRPQPQPQQQQQQPPQSQPQQPPQPQPQQPPKQATPPPMNDPINQILAIQTDVLNLMTEVEKFIGSKKDKRYLFLDEMLTRNLIKLDNIETDGKENIRNARKEAIRCIQKCIAVLEAKAEKGSQEEAQKNQDVEMKAEEQAAGQTEEKTENGEVEMKEQPKETEQSEQKQEQAVPADNKDTPQAADTRPAEATEESKPNKATKNIKKDPSKEVVNKDEKSDAMLVDNKGDKEEMEVDGGASQI